MKKLFYFSLPIFLTFLTTSTNAQQMMIGVRGGVNFADQHYTHLADGESISGRILFVGGAQIDYLLSNSWSLSLQLLYDQKGAHADMKSFSYGYNGSEGTADWTISYFEIPILAKVNFGSGPLRPYLFAGPSIGFLLKNSEVVHALGGTFIPNGIGIEYRIDTTANITDSTYKIDFSPIAGAGISFSLASGVEFFADAGYAFGLTNVDHYSWDKAYGIAVYSRDIRLAVGVLFPIH